MKLKKYSKVLVKKFWVKILTSKLLGRNCVGKCEFFDEDDWYLFQCKPFTVKIQLSGYLNAIYDFK